MLNSRRKLRSAVQAAALAILCLPAVPQGGSGAFTTRTTFYFTGTCSDCQGTGQGVLVLGNYTPGQPFSSGNFLSFTYSSNLIGFTIDLTASNLFASGALPATLPGTASVLIRGQVNGTFQNFQSQLSGQWCAGQSCASDFGGGSSWGLTAPGTTASTVPTVSLPVLAGLTLAMGSIGWMLAKRTSYRNV